MGLAAALLLSTFGALRTCSLAPLPQVASAGSSAPEQPAAAPSRLPAPPPADLDQAQNPLVPPTLPERLAPAPPPREPQWTAHPSGSPALLLAALRTADGALYLAGKDGTLLHSRDGGRSFTPQRVPQRAARATLYALAGGPDGSVFAVGTDGVILRQPRAGAAWERLPSGTEEELRGVAADLDGTLHVVGDRGLILRLPPQGPPAREDLAGNKDTLYAVRQCSGALYAVGDDGALLRAAGGRAPWRRLDSGTTAPLWDIAAVGDTLLVVGTEQPPSPTGEPGLKQGFVLRRGPRDRSFQRVPLPEAQGPLYSIAVHGRDVIAAGSGRAVLRSVDGGARFRREASGALDDPALRQMPPRELHLGVFAAADGELYLFGSQGMFFHRSAAGGG